MEKRICLLASTGVRYAFVKNNGFLVGEGPTLMMITVSAVFSWLAALRLGNKMAPQELCVIAFNFS